MKCHCCGTCQCVRCSVDVSANGTVLSRIYVSYTSCTTEVVICVLLTKICKHRFICMVDCCNVAVCRELRGTVAVHADV